MHASGTTVLLQSVGPVSYTHLDVYKRQLVVRDMMLAQVKSPDQSKAPWDYYNIVRTIPGDSLAWPLSESQCPLVKK